ncbi:hypothetical protein BDY21DRAFT_366819 [Lineolata rhizophorae]|uniref:Uncharacterized protein n=1 Tax=Lineolata rhizophorae TaxID=578093 RepID=A0A6A6NQ21_9PEZI|nr:hypothetical protein BDY21DRAFT_366819 [Lineolata rhizophorae]
MSVKLRVSRAGDPRVREFVPNAIDANTPVAPGSALLKLDRIGLTTNSLTYIVNRELGFLDFFSDPADSEWGHNPVWGVATVVRANGVPGLEPGARLFGYMPVWSYFVLNLEPRADPKAEAGAAAPSDGLRIFRETSPHREAIAIGAFLYNTYLTVAPADAAAAAAADDSDARLVSDSTVACAGLCFARGPLRPAVLGPGATVVVACASSRTALGLAWSLRRSHGGGGDDGGVGTRVVGLTSAGRNRAFVEGTGLYPDGVLAYDEVGERLPAALGAGDGKVFLVDFSGRLDVLVEAQGAVPDARLAATFIGGNAAWERNAAVGAAGAAAGLRGEVGRLNTTAIYQAWVEEEGTYTVARERMAVWKRMEKEVFGGFETVRRKGTEGFEELWGMLLDGEARRPWVDLVCEF